MTQTIQGAHPSEPLPPAVIAEAEPLSAPSLSSPELQPDSLSPCAEKHHTEFASFEEGYIAQHIALADTKAGFVFAGASAVLVYLFNNDGFRSIVLQPAWTPACVLLGAALWFLTIAAIFAFATIVPRLTSSGDGVVFFGAVAARSSAREYRTAVIMLSEGELADARLVHCYDLARVCQRKYDALRRAMWCLLPGITAAVCALLID